MRRIGLTAGAAVLGVLSGQAGAQTVAPPPSPTERARPEFDPVGGRVGSFMIFPRADLTFEYDDSVIETDFGPEDDLILTLRPAVEIESLWQRHRLELFAYLNQSIHADLSSEDELEGGARVAGVLDVTRDSSLRGSIAADALAEDRFSITSFDQAAEPVRYRRILGTLGYTHDLDPLVIGTDFVANYLDFSDAQSRNGTLIEQDFRDSVYLSGTVRGAYEVGPGLSALARLQLDSLSYTNESFTPDPLDRDSTGMEVEAGVLFELTRLIFGELRAGYFKRWSDDPRLPEAGGLSFGGSLTWVPTSLTTVRFFADREIEEGGSLRTAGNLRSQAQLKVEHELLRSLVLEAEAAVANIEPVGPLPDAWEVRGALAGTYYLSRRYRLIARYRYFSRDSEPPFREFNKNEFLITLRVVL